MLGGEFFVKRHTQLIVKTFSSGMVHEAGRAALSHPVSAMAPIEIGKPKFTRAPREGLASNGFTESNTIKASPEGHHGPRRSHTKVAVERHSQLVERSQTCRTMS